MPGAAKRSPSVGRRGDLELVEDRARLADRGEVGEAEPPGSFVFAAIESLPGLATKRATAWPIAFACPELPSIAGMPTAAIMPNSLRRSSGDFFCFAAS